MTDRELLELAAKAAGIGAEYDEKWGVMLITTTVIDPDDGLVFWDPLNDDGDALRLAVKLSIDLQFQKWDCRAFYADHCQDADRGVCEEPFGIDPYAATRRAITRAAAEIGKAIP